LTASETNYSRDPYPYVDSAVGGVNRRNNVIRLDEYSPNGHADCFTTYLRFPEAFRAHAEHNAQQEGNQSVKGYRGVAKADFVPLDYDDEEDPGRALEDVRRSVRVWEVKHNLPPKAIRIHFSGGKGFHLELPEQLFGHFQVSKDIAQKLKAVAIKLREDAGSLDTDIYDPVRLWRTPNTRHSRTRLFKIPISIEEVFTLTLEDIRELAKQPRPDFIHPDPDEYGPVSALVELWKAIEDGDIGDGEHRERLDVAEVLKGVPKGERDQKLFRLASKMRGADVPYAFARKLTLEAAANCDPPFPEDEAIQKVESAYSRYEPNAEFVVGGRKPPTPGVSILYGGRDERGREWPTMEEEAFRGLFGRIVGLAEEHTEGDRVALLVGAMIAFGSAVGRGPHMQIGATKHHTNLFVGVVGDTSKGRKGSTWDPIENVMHAADRRWTENRIQSGLSSGEGLIAEVRDRIEVPDKDGNMRIADPGVPDKRLLVMEGELSQVLKVIKRDGNTLSPVLRNAWDGKNLKTMVKHSPLKATGPHVSILGHITRGELVRHLTETEIANGLANRYLWLLVRRSKRLPFGGEWHTVNLQPISREIVGALEYTNRTVRMRWAKDARPLWAEAYEALTEDRPGMLGAVTARAEAQTLRLAMLYALADCSDELRRTHIESALAVWEYAEESARYIFGDAIGDPDADKVLETLKECADGLTRTEVRDLFGRNRSGEELDRILKVLADAGRVRVTRHREGGSKKPVERWHAA
jgi:hypothetical protein